MYDFETEFEVRDYECDIQGIVNNSVYQNYLEHTRHKFLTSLGHDFAKLSKQGINPVVYKVIIEYKKPLKSGDKFICRLKMQKEGNLKLIFKQDIYRKPDEMLMVKGEVTAVVLKNGRPVKPDFLVS